jgi:putative peptide zinc metalloprotease protein
VLSTLGAAAVVLVPALLVPAPARVRAEAIAEPREFEVIRARVDGFVESAAPTGSAVGPGDHAAPLVILRNDDLVHRRDALSADLDRLRAARALAFRDDPARALQIDRQIEATNDQANALDADLASLRPCAAIPGTWIAPRIDRLPGTHLARGTTIGIVADPSGMRLRAVLDQRAAAAVIAEAGATVEVRALGRPEPCLRATLARVLPAGQRRLPSAALGLAAGGTTPTRPDDQEHRATTQDVFEAWIDLPPGHGLRPGQRAVVRFTLRPAPPLVQAARALRQTLQDKFNI